MKLLVSWMRELGGYVSREFYYIMQDLISVAWMAADAARQPVAASGSVEECLLKRIRRDSRRCSVLGSVRPVQPGSAPALKDLGCRTVLFADDMHMLWGQESRRSAKLQAFSQCDVLLASYAYVFDEFYPELRGRKTVVWTPHSASPDFGLPFNNDPENAVLLSGALGGLYHLRLQLKELQKQGRYPIVQHAHPGYAENYDYDTDTRVGVGYARTINRFKAAFTDALTLGYVVAKHFEIPATGTLLVADGAVSGPLRELGFCENVHYIPVTAENLEEKIQYILDERNRVEIEEIRRRGQELVLNNHRTWHRAELIDTACAPREYLALYG